MSSSSDRVSLSNSGSERSRDSGSSRDDTSDREETWLKLGKIRPRRAESNWPAKAGYEWVATDVQTQRSLFRWSRLLRLWLNCTPIFEKGVKRDIIALERVTIVECVCHGREGVAEEFFYMYMCHFSQLHIRLPFDEFTMEVLRLLTLPLLNFI